MRIFDKRIENVFVALDPSFDAAIAEVARPSVNAPGCCLTFYPGPKTHTLHNAVNEHVKRHGTTYTEKRELGTPL